MNAPLLKFLWNGAAHHSLRSSAASLPEGVAARLFAFGIAVFSLATLKISWQSPLSHALQGQQPIFGLLIGTDLVDYARHADTIVLVRYDPAARALDLLSIPRDTKIDFPHEVKRKPNTPGPLGQKAKKINEVYAHAFRTTKDHHFSSQELSRAVHRMLFSNLQSSSTPDAPGGVSNAPLPLREGVPEISFYVQLEYEGFKRAIELLGGVEVTIDEPMHYDDRWGKLHIHFDRGTYILNGEKALEYVRFRGLSGDFGRVSRQQQFLLNLLNRFKKPANVFKLPKILFVSVPLVRTNLGALERLLLLWELKDLPKERIRLLQLPGRSQSGYWIPDYDGIRATAALLASGKKSISELPFGLLKGTDALSGKAENRAIPDSRIKGRSVPSQTTVEVWNASSKKGLALEVVRKLRHAGFDVVKWGNYSSRQARTFVRDHQGDIQQARAIVTALSSPRVEIFTRLETKPLVDVEVILGEDYETGK